MDDTISRQAAQRLFGKALTYKEQQGKLIWATAEVKQFIADLIEVLPSAQPGCEDAVSRADVDILIEEAQTAWLKGDILLMYPVLKKGLQKVPSVTPKQPGWIPCTPETMPQESDEYLVTVKWGEGDCDVDIYEYNAYHKEWNDGELYGAMVIAWQPKLEPWEGDANG